MVSIDAIQRSFWHDILNFVAVNDRVGPVRREYQGSYARAYCTDGSHPVGWPKNLVMADWLYGPGSAMFVRFDAKGLFTSAPNIEVIARLACPILIRSLGGDGRIPGDIEWVRQAWSSVKRAAQGHL